MTTLKNTLSRLLGRAQTIKMAFLLWLAAWILTGCASGTLPMQVQPRPCPASLTAPCPLPPAARTGSLADLLANHLDAMELYSQCRDQQAKLAECVK